MFNPNPKQLELLVVSTIFCISLALLKFWIIILVNSILRPFLLALARDRSNSSALGLAFGVLTRTTEFICLHFLSSFHRQNCGCSARVFDWDYLFTFSRSWSWKPWTTILQTTTKCRNSTNNDKITCIRCEINYELTLKDSDLWKYAGEMSRSRHSNYILQKFRCEVLSWVG